MKIDMPSIAEQQQIIYQAGLNEAVAQLEANKAAKVLPGQKEVDESLFPRTHLLRDSEGWEPPHPDIVGAYFRHFQGHFPEYGTDAKLAALLGLSSDRRIRDFKAGSVKVPYGVWRKFLVMTGRVTQDIIKVFAVMA